MVNNLFEYLEIDGTWYEADLTNIHNCYLIAIKNDSTEDDTLDVNKVTKIGLELGIESGIKVDDVDKPLTIQRVILNFEDETSSDEYTNKISAFIKLTGLPTKLYIKPIFIDIDEIRHFEGSTSISINISK